MTILTPNQVALFAKVSREVPVNDMLFLRVLLNLFIDDGMLSGDGSRFVKYMQQLERQPYFWDFWRKNAHNPQVRNVLVSLFRVARVPVPNIPPTVRVGPLPRPPPYYPQSLPPFSSFGPPRPIPFYQTPRLPPPPPPPPPPPSSPWPFSSFGARSSRPSPPLPEYIPTLPPPPRRLPSVIGPNRQTPRPSIGRTWNPFAYHSWSDTVQQKKLDEMQNKKMEKIVYNIVPNESTLPPLSRATMDFMVRHVVERLEFQKDGVGVNVIGDWLHKSMGRAYQNGWVTLVIAELEKRGYGRLSKNKHFFRPVGRYA